MLVLLAVFLNPAVAGAPTAQAATFTTGASTVTGGSVDEYGDLFAFTSANKVVAVDVTTWSLLTAAPCNVSSATVIETGLVWVGCTDGTIRPMGISDGLLVAIEDGNGAVVVEPDSAISDEVAGLFYYAHSTGDEYVFAVYDTAPTATLVRFNARGTYAAGAPNTLRESGFVAGAVGPQTLFISHGSDRMTSVQLPLGAPLFQSGFYGIDVDDVAAAGGLSQSAFAVERGDSAQVAMYSHPQQNFLLGPQIDDNIQALGVSTVDGESWALFAYSDRVDVRPMSGGRVTGTTIDDTFALNGSARDVIVGPGGYTLVGMTSGKVAVLTDRPWVSGTTAQVDGKQVSQVGNGQEVLISAVSDRAGDWTITLGGTWDDPDSGEQLDSGTLTAPGPIEASFAADGWTEGSNTVFVRLTADGASGHDGVNLTVDVAPPAVSLSDASLAFEDETLTLKFVALETEDIKKYMVYISTVPFVAGDYPSGGPAYEGDDEISAPFEITEFEPNKSVSLSITPLTNDQTYYLAVRATDTGGLEGTMSAVIEGRPRPTKTAAEAAGETGGMDCNNSAGFAAWPMALVGLLAIRRRRWSVLAAGLVGAVAVMTTASAVAQDEPVPDPEEMPEEEPPWGSFDNGNGDLTEAWGSVEVRYGLYRGKDASIEQVYGNGVDAERRSSASSLMIEFGPQIYRVVEVDFGVGYLPRKGFTIDSEGKPSLTPAKLTIVPLSASITPRLHIFDEQPVVPFASIGADWWLFRERKGEGDADTKKVLDGSKFGWHWELGLNVLLDVFDRRRASLLEAQSGINDSWITMSFRRQVIESKTTGFNFSGDTIEVGLKLDF